MNVLTRYFKRRRMAALADQINLLVDLYEVAVLEDGSIIKELDDRIDRLLTEHDELGASI